MADLFLTVLDMSLSASILVLAVVGLRFALKKAPRWMICALWAMVALRLIFPVTLESAFSLIPRSIGSGNAAESLSDIHTGEILVMDDTDPGFQAAVDAGRTPEYSGASEGQTHYVVTTAPDGISEPRTLASDLSLVWIAGMTAMVLYAAVSYLLLGRKVAASICLQDNIRLCDYIDTPFILGIFRPRIYLPSSLDRAQWPHVIAHEQAHLARKDHWWKPIGFALLCVYWFNPVLWLAYILLCRDIELACDERVIRDMDPRQKQDYTTALLECSMPRYLVAACPLAFGEVGVKERVKSVLNYKKPAFWIVLIALILSMITAICFLTDPPGRNSITPGTYTIGDQIYGTNQYDEWNGNITPGIPAGKYILHNNTLYYEGKSGIIALGSMAEYALDNIELRDYIRVDSGWNSFLHHIPTVSDAMWLWMENGAFYIWFQTNNGETYLACGVEDYGERHEGYSDDTYITHITRLIPDHKAEELELAWFDASVMQAEASWLLVAPDPGTWEARQGSQIVVSRWWHDSYIDPEGNTVAVDGFLSGEFTAGDRVRIVYDGQVQETSPARISSAYSTTILPPPTDQYTVRSGDAEITPLHLPANTDVSIISGLPVIKLAYTNGQPQFQLLRNGERNPGHFSLYDYETQEKIKDFDYVGNLTGPNWDMLEPGRNYLVVQERDGMLCFIAAVPYDLGITLTAKNVTPTGMTVTCTQSGGNCPVEISYGNPQGYWLRRSTENGWENVPNLDGTIGGTTTTENRILQRNSSVSWTYDWTNRFGALEPGDYRYDLYFSHGETPEDMSYLCHSVFFTISGDGSLRSPFTEYRGLNTPKGLELYALEDGYVLMAGTNREKTESEINALPRATAEEMKEILAAYTADGALDVRDIFLYNRTDREESHIRQELGILPQWEISLEVTHATSTEALIVYHINNLGPGEVWTGYDYHLEVLTDDGWVHYGYPPEEMAWESALLFHTSDHYPLDSQNQEIFVADWSRTADAPLPPGTYRYCKGVTVCYGEEYTNLPLYATFEIPEDTPEDPGIHIEVQNPTSTGATLAITYNGGLMGELTTGGQYYLMKEQEGGWKSYGRLPAQAVWDAITYRLTPGETLYLDVLWAVTADGPLAPGSYCVVLQVDQTVPDNGAAFQFLRQAYGAFTVAE